MIVQNRVIVFSAAVFVIAAPVRAVDEAIATSVLQTWKMIERQFVALAEAMPADRYSFAPKSGEFKGVRTFAEQVKHVACANFGFFREMRLETPPAHCETGGDDPARTKDQLVRYLRASFQLGSDTIGQMTPASALENVSGPYGGTRTRLGMAVLGVWHVSDHYGQIVEYLRMNGIVPPASQPQPAAR